MRTNEIRPTSATSPDTAESHTCGRSSDRRTFLRDVALFAAAVVAAQGLAPNSALAGTVREITPTTAVGRERGYTIPSSDSVSVDAREGLVLVRTHGKVFAFSIECPHRGRTLEWQPDSQQLYCPKHKARFGTDGSNVGGRRTSPLDRFALRRDGSRVMVALDRVLSSKDQPAEWAAAAIDV